MSENTGHDPEREFLRLRFVELLKESGAATQMAACFVGYDYAVRTAASCAVDNLARALGPDGDECDNLRAENTALKQRVGNLEYEASRREWEWANSQSIWQRRIQDANDKLEEVLRSGPACELREENARLKQRVEELEKVTATCDKKMEEEADG